MNSATLSVLLLCLHCVFENVYQLQMAIKTQVAWHF